MISLCFPTQLSFWGTQCWCGRSIKQYAMMSLPIDRSTEKCHVNSFIFSKDTIQSILHDFFIDFLEPRLWNCDFYLNHPWIYFLLQLDHSFWNFDIWEISIRWQHQRDNPKQLCNLKWVIILSMSIDMLNERSTFLKACFLVFTLNLSAMLQQSQTGTVLRRGQYCASLV